MCSKLVCTFYVFLLNNIKYIYLHFEHEPDENNINP